MLTLGLDLGHTSLSWALCDVLQNKIIDGGIVLFDTPEDEKGRTLASKRGESSRSRTTIQNHAQRLLKLKKLCVKHKLVKKSDLVTKEGKIAPLFRKGIKNSTPLKLRTKALYEPLNPREFTRVIIHIASRRGFKFDFGESNEEEGKIQEHYNKLESKFGNFTYQTYGEFLYNEYELKGKKTRNRANKQKEPTYEFSIHRDKLFSELELIFKKQKSMQNSFATDAFKELVLQELMFVNEPQSIKNMIGSCSLIKGKKRAPKALYKSEIYVARAILLNLRVKEPEEKEYRQLNKDEIELLLKEAHTRKISKTEAKKLLSLPTKSKFKSTDEDEKESAIVDLKSYLIVKGKLDSKLFDKLFSQVEAYELLVDLLTYEKSLKRRKVKLADILTTNKFSPKEQEHISENLLYLTFKGYLNISVEASDKILPYLENGLRVDEAIEEENLKIDIIKQTFYHL